MFYEQIPRRPPLHLRLLLPGPMRAVGRRSVVGDETLCVYDRGHLLKRVTRIEPRHHYGFDVVEQDLAIGRGVRLAGGSYTLRELPDGSTRIGLETLYVSPGRPRWLWGRVEAAVCHAFHRHILGAMRREVRVARLSDPMRRVRFGVLFGVAMEALARNKLRSGLTALGIVVGVAAVVTMAGIGEGSKASIESAISSLGSNFVVVYPGIATQGGARIFTNQLTMTEADVAAVRDECPSVAHVSAISRTGGQVVSGDVNWGTIILGVGADFPAVRSWDVRREPSSRRPRCDRPRRSACSARPSRRRCSKPRTPSTGSCASGTSRSGSWACSAPRAAA